VVRRQRIRHLNDIVDEYLVGYRLRYRSATFAEYALGHVSRLLGAETVVDIDEAAWSIIRKTACARKPRPNRSTKKFDFLKMLGDLGEVIRARLCKKKQLNLAVRKKIGKAFDSEETESLAAKARTQSAHVPAFMLARNAGLRDTEIKKLAWGQIDLKAKSLQVGKSKSDAGEGRVVPLNSDLYDALVEHNAWYQERFLHGIAPGAIRGSDSNGSGVAPRFHWALRALLGQIPVIGQYPVSPSTAQISEVRKFSASLVR
jgi:integrase